MKTIDLRRAAASFFGRLGESLFFFLLAAAIFTKFYFVEYEVSRLITRFPMSVAASAAISVIIAALVSMCPGRARLAIALTADFLITVLALTDALHMRFYSDLFTFRNLILTAQVGDVKDSVFALFSFKDILYFIDIPLLFCYYKFFSRISGRKLFGRITLLRVIVTLLIIALCVAVVAQHIRLYNKKVPRALRAMWDRPAVCNNVGAMTYHLADAYNLAYEYINKPSLSRDDIEKVREDYEKLKALRIRPKQFGIAEGKNLILIQAESLQSFVIGLKFNGHEVTPNLNAFVKEATYSANAYSQTGSGNSSDAEFLANAAFYPAASGTAFNRFAHNTFEAFPYTLNKNGYKTFAMHGDRASFWNRVHMYPSLGFPRYVSKKDYIVDDSIGLGLSDRSFFKQSLAMMLKEPQPFFAFMVTLSSHYPFGFPKLMKESRFVSIGEYKNTIVGSYLVAIHYFDREFGEFIKELKRTGLYDKSIIAVYGDHNAIPRWDSANLSKLLGRDYKKDYVWRRELRVPFIINVPGVEKLQYAPGKAIGLIDMPRTLAMLLGIDFDSGLGGDVFSDAEAPVIFRNGSYVTGVFFVEPEKKSAVNIKTGEAANYDDFREITERVRKTLDLSDKILEHDLMPKIRKEGSD
ncbi:MAG: LTA synthase family protein [Synergistes sp.]|nr:LTA synthase family protein [Synergistes sp.]